MQRTTFTQSYFLARFRTLLSAILAVVVMATFGVQIAAQSTPAASSPIGEERIIVDTLPLNVRKDAPGVGAGKLGVTNQIDTYQFKTTAVSTDLRMTTWTCDALNLLKFRLVNAQSGAVVMEGAHNCQHYHRMVLPAGEYALSVFGEGLKRDSIYGLKLQAASGKLFPMAFGAREVPGENPPPGAGVLETRDSADEYLFEVPQIEGTVTINGHMPGGAGAPALAVIPAEGNSSTTLHGRHPMATVSPGRYILVVGAIYGPAPVGPYSGYIFTNVEQQMTLQHFPTTIDSSVGNGFLDISYGDEQETYQLPQRRRQIIGVRVTDCEVPSGTLALGLREGSSGTVNCGGKQVAGLTDDQGRFHVRSEAIKPGKFRMHVEAQPADLIEIPGMPVTVGLNAPQPGAGVFADGQSEQTFYVKITPEQTTLFITGVDCASSVPLVLKRGKNPDHPIGCGRDTYAHIDADTSKAAYQVGGYLIFTIAPAPGRDGKPRPGTDLPYSFRLEGPAFDYAPAMKLPFRGAPDNPAVGIGRLESGRSVDRYALSLNEWYGEELSFQPTLEITGCSKPGARVKFKVHPSQWASHTGVAKCNERMRLPMYPAEYGNQHIEIYPDNSAPYIGEYSLTILPRPPAPTEPYVVLDAWPKLVNVGAPVNVSVTVMKHDGTQYVPIKLSSGYTLSASPGGSCTATQCRASQLGDFGITATIDPSLGYGTKLAGSTAVKVGFPDQPDLSVSSPTYEMDWESDQVILEFRVKNVGGAVAGNVALSTVVFDANPETIGPPVGIAGKVCTSTALFADQTLHCRVTLPKGAPLSLTTVSRATSPTKEPDYANNTLVSPITLPAPTGAPDGAKAR